MCIAALAAVLMVVLTSCDSTEAFIQAEVTAANRLCPMPVGNGLTLISAEYTGLYVRYDYKGDDSMHYFSQDLVDDAAKDEIVNELRANAARDKNVDKFIKALKKKHVGIIYHYFTDSSAMDIVVSSNDL